MTNQKPPPENAFTVDLRADDGNKDEKSRRLGSINRQIGPYKLLQKIGEGGMGEVWMADQEEPIRRRVALKLIKRGLDNKQIIARFEAERQALAMMDQQNIAKVLDAGTTDNGAPYFVMELVQGIPLTKYCDQNRLSIDERLELFLPVCQAVQHAHQKGIIHRDLKPSNVLVCQYDGKPIPKVIDFGLAKALQHQSRLTDKTMFTEFGQVVGTLQYMSPEQAGLNQLDIDTRTDIYSLGVMLYELLTGSTPIDADSMRQQAILQVLETIRSKDPPRPSMRLSSVAQEAASGISEQRRIEVSKLRSILSGELDWIVMKALEKDRTRRYESASGFAADIRRYLNHEPVLARPPSVGYRLKKFVRKNRAAVLGASVIALAVVLEWAGTVFGLLKALQKFETAQQQSIEAYDYRAQQQPKRKETEEAQSLAESEKTAEELALAEESRQRKYAEVVNTFVKQDSLELTSEESVSHLEEAISFLQTDNDLTRAVLLDRAAEKLQQLDNLVPQIESRLCDAFAKSYTDHGDVKKAIPFLQRALKIRQELLGPEHFFTLFSMNSLASGYHADGQLDKALPLME